MRMRKWLCLFFMFLLLTASGGCGGGGGEEGRKFSAEGTLGLVAGGLPENQVDAYGYFDAEVVMYSEADMQEASGLLLILFGMPENGGREEALGSVAIKHMREGEHKYRFRMYGAAYNCEMDFLKTGKYVNTKLALIHGDNFDGEAGAMSVELDTDVYYTAAGELPVIVKDSIEIDVKQPPSHLGFSQVNRLAKDDKGWWRMEAGKVNGAPVIVAYTAIVDLRLELSCASYDVEAFEIKEKGGALLLGKGQDEPAKTLFWKGPFQSGEAGVSFTVMYWGNVEPPDISTLSFTVRPIKAPGSKMDDGRFIAHQAADETLRATAYSMASAEDSAINYRDFASILWHLWRVYELDNLAAGRESEWDTDVGPAYWYATLLMDLSKVVDWDTAVAEYSGLAGVKMKSDFFYGDRPINFEDPNRNRNQFIRIPKVYYDAEQEYNNLYSTSSSPFPFGDEAYLSWWCTLPTWMLRELVFPVPNRSYGNLTIGDAKGDDYLWQVAFPMFLKVAAAHGIQSYEYALFWNEELGLLQDGNPDIEPSRSRDAYKALFPKALPVPISLLDGDYSGFLQDITNKKPITFEYSESYVRYYNDLSSKGSLGGGSTKLNAGYELSYSDGVFFHADRYYPNEHYLTVHNWTTLALDVPVWVFDHKTSVLDAGVAFNSYISADAALSSYTELSGIKWGNQLFDERTTFEAHLSIFGTTLFDRRLLFALENEEKSNIKDHNKETYPLVSKAFEKAIIDPKKASVSLGPVEISFGLGVLGEAGINFNYMYGKIKKPTDAQYVVNSHVAGVRMELEPYGRIGANAQVSVGLPIKPPAPPVELAVKGEVNVVRLGLPLYFEREMGFAAEKMMMTAEGPIPSDNGELYYTLRNRGEYGMDLDLGGLDGELKLEVNTPVYKKEFDLYKWDGIDYYNTNLFKATQFLPLSLPVKVTP